MRSAPLRGKRRCHVTPHNRPSLQRQVVSVFIASMPRLLSLGTKDVAAPFASGALMYRPQPAGYSP